MLTKQTHLHFRVKEIGETSSELPRVALENEVLLPGLAEGVQLIDCHLTGGGIHLRNAIGCQGVNEVISIRYPSTSLHREKAKIDEHRGDVIDMRQRVHTPH